MDAFDLGVRNTTYRLFVDVGRAPTAQEVADDAGHALSEVEASWRRLHEQHALVLERDRPSLRMANPFSAVPTRFTVHANDRWWHANCAWDAFGICAALHADGHISTTCPDCGEPLEIDVVEMLPGDTTLLFHSLVPASRWWDDIVFT
jgi:hypothetical protein